MKMDVDIIKREIEVKKEVVISKEEPRKKEKKKKDRGIKLLKKDGDNYFLDHDDHIYIVNAAEKSCNCPLYTHTKFPCKHMSAVFGVRN